MEIVDRALPWDFPSKLMDYLKPNSRVLDLFPLDDLLLQQHLSTRYLASVLSPDDPQKAAFCAAGVCVESATADTGSLPFADGSFDVIFSREKCVPLDEVYRVLTPGGYYLLQCRGSRDCSGLIGFVYSDISGWKEDFNLENQLPLWERAGFRVLYRHQAYPVVSLSPSAVRARIRTAAADFGPSDSDRVLEAVALAEQGQCKDIAHRVFVVGQKKR